MSKGKNRAFNRRVLRKSKKLVRFLDIGGKVKMLGRYCRFNYGGGV
jgi:hypothetical protein